MKDRLACATWVLCGLILAVLAMGLGADVLAGPRAKQEPVADPNIFERAWGAVAGTADKYTNDEAIADYVMASVAKQERVNRILKRRGSRYRISELSVVIGVSPALHVGITELADSTAAAEDSP